MSNSIIVSCMLVFLYSPVTSPDHGFKRIKPNNTGRCWKIVNRDFENKDRFESCVSFKFLTVEGDGQTDDLFTYELQFKEDYLDGNGWDESKTRVYTGTGLIKVMAKGRIYFEYYVSPGNSAPLVTGAGYYHAGHTSADSDDSLVLHLPAIVDFEPAPPLPGPDPCAEILRESDAAEF